MTDVTVAYDNTGTPLDELPILVERAANLNRSISADKGYFHIPYSNAKAVIRNLRVGNILTTNSDQPGIPAHAALVWEPSPAGTEVDNGQYTVKLRSAEWILGTRYTSAQDILSGKPGEVVIALVDLARREGFLPISTDYSGVNFGGKNIGPIEFNDANIFEAINKIASENAAFWWIEPSVTNENSLSLKLNFVYKRTRAFQTPLSATGANKNFIISKINQSGRYDLANHVKAVGRAKDKTVRLEYEERNQLSIGYYKGVYTKVIQCPQINSVEGLVPIVQSYIEESAFPRLRIQGIVTRAPYPRVGDVCNVITSNYGPLISARRGPIISMTIESTFYSPKDGNLSITLLEELQ